MFLRKILALAAAVAATAIPTAPIQMANNIKPIIPLETHTMPPVANKSAPCRPAGTLHLDFGGDIANFGAAQEALLTKMILLALKLKPDQLQVTRMTDADDTGSGKIVHPTKVRLNFKFEGSESIELGYKLENNVATGSFKPLADFPLLRLQMEEIYCTEAPTGVPSLPPTISPTLPPTAAPTVEPTATPTEDPTAEPTLIPTEEPTAEPTMAPTEEPTTLPPTTDKPSFSPSQTPTEEPTAVPTEAPTETPTASPTELPTEEPTAVPSHAPTTYPTREPTGKPTIEPTAQPTELPTIGPTKAPTGCNVRAAKMHILFSDLYQNSDSNFDAHEAELQSAMCKELNKSPDQVSVRSYHDGIEGTGVWHTEVLFKGLESIMLGYKLEKSVLANKFNPIPEYPIRRLYMEEVFDCGEHAVGAIHPYNGKNDKGAKWIMPKSGWENKSGKTIPVAPSVAIVAPVSSMHSASSQGAAIIALPAQLAATKAFTCADNCGYLTSGQKALCVPEGASAQLTAFCKSQCIYLSGSRCITKATTAPSIAPTYAPTGVPKPLTCAKDCGYLTFGQKDQCIPEGATAETAAFCKSKCIYFRGSRCVPNPAVYDIVHASTGSLGTTGSLHMMGGTTGSLHMTGSLTDRPHKTEFTEIGTSISSDPEWEFVSMDHLIEEQ